MNNSIVPSIRSKIPDFVREKYPRFESLLIDYYSWLESEGGFLNQLEHAEDNHDVFKASQEYLDRMLNELGWFTKKDTLIAKHKLFLFISDFMKSRGSADSFTFLFRALFNEEVEIRYPRDEMLVASGAVFGKTYSVFLSVENKATKSWQHIVDNVGNLSGELKGISSGTKATIEGASIVLGNTSEYLKLKILKPTTEFIAGETVSVTVDGQVIFERIFNVLGVKVTTPGKNNSKNSILSVSGCDLQGHYEVASVTPEKIESVDILSGGSGYQVGDFIKAAKQNGAGGFSARVKTVSGGAITSIEIIDGGYGYKTAPEIYVVRKTSNAARIQVNQSTIGGIASITRKFPFVNFDPLSVIILASGSGTSIQSIEETIFEETGWEDRRGFIGENCTLTDSNRVQQFSYEIVSAVNPDRYINEVDYALHPTGFVRVPVVRTINHVDGSQTASSSMTTQISSKTVIVSNSGDYIAGSIIEGNPDYRLEV